MKFSILLLVAIVVNVLSFGGYGSFYNYLPCEFHTSLIISPTVKKADTIIFEEVEEEERLTLEKISFKPLLTFDLIITNHLSKHQFQTINELASTIESANQQAFLLHQYQFSKEEIFSV